MRWQTSASNVSIRTISPTATPQPKAYGCVAVYIAGRRTNLVYMVVDRSRQPKKIGDKMPPCFTPFSVAKNSDLTPFHVVHMSWRMYHQVIDDWPAVVILYYVIKQIICQGGHGQTLWMHPEYTRIHLYAYYCNKRLFLWSLWYTYSWNGIACMQIAYHWWTVYVYTFQSLEYQ